MAVINQEGFARKIVEYHLNSERSEEWFHPYLELRLKDGSVQSTLNPPFEKVESSEGRTYSYVTTRGISFGYTTRLVMQLIERAYQGLQQKPEIQEYAKAVASSIQQFAQQFPNNQSTLCYPHFLMHGIAQPELEDVVNKISANARIIRETLEARDKIMNDYGQIQLAVPLKLMMSSGCTDDYFGIAHLLSEKDVVLVSSASNYIAKASFFVDTTQRDIYVMTLQGRRWGDSRNPVRASDSLEITRRLEAERKYGKIGNMLGMGPRRFILSKVMDFGKTNEFVRIRVIKPQEHPMFIERHVGFTGNYEPIIHKAGIKKEKGCYLEAEL